VQIESPAACGFGELLMKKAVLKRQGFLLSHLLCPGFLPASLEVEEKAREQVPS